MFDSTDNVGPYDFQPIQTIKLSNNTIYLKKHDPHGHWTVNFDKGQMPQSLQGEWTDYTRAKAAVMSYLKSKGREGEIIAIST